MARRTRHLPPGLVLLASFLLASLLGAGLLLMPVARTVQLDFLDAWFTAVSAVCVTGLAVADTGTAFTTFGQVVILVLVQVGGIGIMTFFYVLLAALGRHPSLSGRSAIADVFLQEQFVSIRKLILRISLFTFLIEALGALCLFVLLRHQEGALFHAVFHAVSAFCNAGFSTWPDSLVQYQTDVSVQACASLLIILGGMGYTVVFALLAVLFRKQRYRTHLLSLHGRLVLWSTGILLVVGTVLFMALEWNHAASLGGLGLGGKLQVSFFQSVTARTAGFNSVDIGALRTSTLMIMMALMFIGGSPGSCAGGVKTTSMFLFVHSVIQRIRGLPRTTAFRREIPVVLVRRAFALIVVSGVAVMLAAFLFAFSLELSGSALQGDMRGIMFQCTSALATVGLSVWSLEAMAGLPALSKLLLIALMFLGRVGPLTVTSAVLAEEHGVDLRYPEENVLIG